MSCDAPLLYTLFVYMMLYFTNTYGAHAYGMHSSCIIVARVRDGFVMIFPHMHGYAYMNET